MPARRRAFGYCQRRSRGERPHSSSRKEQEDQCSVVLPLLRFLGSPPPPTFITLFLKIIYLFIYLWLCWVFVSVRGLSLVAASGGHSSSRCAGLSLSRALLLQSTDSRRAGSVIVAHGLSCSATCGIFPDQGSNPCPLHWQADSQPLHHQGSPRSHFQNRYISCPHPPGTTGLCLEPLTFVPNPFWAPVPHSAVLPLAFYPTRSCRTKGERPLFLFFQLHREVESTCVSFTKEHF